MLIAIIGENCVGKSTLAKKINERFGATIYSGKDYLRLAKNPSVAMETFKATLQASVKGDNIIYLITEQEHLSLLPEGSFRIVLTAELETIKTRFKERMRGHLPVPVELHHLPAPVELHHFHPLAYVQQLYQRINMFVFFSYTTH